jgi:hypothetical protein
MPIMQDGLITAARAHDQADRKVRDCALDVQSRHLVDWIEDEPVGLGCPDFADIFVGREALEGLCARAGVKLSRQLRPCRRRAGPSGRVRCGWYDELSLQRPFQRLRRLISGDQIRCSFRSSRR